MQELERLLSPTDFCRVHRGAIVRLDRVRELRTTEAGEYLACLHDGTELPVSRSHRLKFFAALRRG
jgi:DNA-binding LytR/AlgR family response regulator